MFPRGAVAKPAQTDLKFRSSLRLAGVKNGRAASLSLRLRLSSQKDQRLVNPTLPAPWMAELIQATLIQTRLIQTSQLCPTLMTPAQMFDRLLLRARR